MVYQYLGKTGSCYVFVTISSPGLNFIILYNTPWLNFIILYNLFDAISVIVHDFLFLQKRAFSFENRRKSLNILMSKILYIIRVVSYLIEFWKMVIPLVAHWTVTPLNIVYYPE